MSEADEVRAGIDAAIDLEERTMVRLRQLEDDLDLLQGQLIIVGMGSNSPRARSAIRMTQMAKADLTQVTFDILEVRTALNEWRERP